MTLHFHSDGLSPLAKETKWCREVLHWVAEDLRLKRDVRFFLQGACIPLSREGKPELTPPADQIKFEHDGDAWDSGVVRVALSPVNMDFPFVWEINPECGTGYIIGVAYMEDIYHLFVWYAAHELRHLWQWEHKKQIRQIRGLLRCTDETDADIYAARMLSKWKMQ